MLSSPFRCRNFNWYTRVSTPKRGKRRKKRRIAKSVVRNPGEPDCMNANRYVTHMLAASLGLKLADAGRRILMYTKPTDDYKSFYAVCRGLFPIQELCGTITALSLAKRDLLGVDIPFWKVVGPAVVIHGMANFRGMKVSYQNMDSKTLYYRLILLAYTGSFPLAAHLQVEFGNALVGDANVAVEFSGRHYIPRNRQESIRKDCVGYHFDPRPWLLCKELLHGQSQSCKANYKVCW